MEGSIMTEDINDRIEQEKKAQTNPSGDARVRDIMRSRGKYLVFTLDGKRYCVSLTAVKEVIGMTDFTPVPGVPSFFKGLINLRGSIHSIIDLRNKLQLPEASYQPKKTSIVIVEIDGLTLGAIVDDVCEVIGLETDQIQRNLSISSNINREYIVGVAKGSDSNLTLLLDIVRVVNTEEWALVHRQRPA
jgi:purine-binding chemotaxis protein CheW